MRWNTQVKYIAAKTNSEELIEENITVTIDDKEITKKDALNVKQSLQFQILAWQAVKQVKPEWVPETHRTGLAILPVSPDFQFQHVKLSHEYTPETK